MRRILAISDIHGCLDEFDRLLELAGYDPRQDRLLLLGDYIDRGPRSKETVNRVMTLVRDCGAVALRGNHDQRLVDLIRGGDEIVMSKFLEHGGREAAVNYLELPDDSKPFRMEDVIAHIGERYRDQIEFLESLPLYYEEAGHIFVHAGIDPSLADWKSQPPELLMSIKEPFYYQPTAVRETVVFGHTKTADIHGRADVWFGDGKIGIDGGCAEGLQLNALEISADDGYHTYSVPGYRKSPQM